MQLTRGLSGLALGMVLSFAGFADYGEVHRMFCFTDLRLTLAFGLAVALAAVGFRLTRARACLPANRLHGGILPGGVLFGAGWALTGACPSAAFVQLGEGQLPAVVTCVGIFCGILLFRAVRPAPQDPR